MLGRHLDRLVQIGAPDDVVARGISPLRLRKRPVRDHHLTAADRYSGRILNGTQPVPMLGHAAGLYFSNPFLDVVLGGHILRRCGIGLDKKHVFHGVSLLAGSGRIPARYPTGKSDGGTRRKFVRPGNRRPK